jgi:hypothetical protein
MVSQELQGSINMIGMGFPSFIVYQYINKEYKHKIAYEESEKKIHEDLKRR